MHLLVKRNFDLIKMHGTMIKTCDVLLNFICFLILSINFAASPTDWNFSILILLYISEFFQYRIMPGLRGGFLVIYLIADQGINHLSEARFVIEFFTCDRNWKHFEPHECRTNQKNPIFFNTDLYCNMVTGRLLALRRSKISQKLPDFLSSLHLKF